MGRRSEATGGAYAVKMLSEMCHAPASIPTWAGQMDPHGANGAPRLPHRMRSSFQPSGRTFGLSVRDTARSGPGCDAGGSRWEGRES